MQSGPLKAIKITLSCCYCYLLCDIMGTGHCCITLTVLLMTFFVRLTLLLILLLLLLRVISYSDYCAIWKMFSKETTIESTEVCLLLIAAFFNDCFQYSFLS